MDGGAVAARPTRPAPPCALKRHTLHSSTITRHMKRNGCGCFWLVGWLAGQAGWLAGWAASTLDRAVHWVGVQRRSSTVWGRAQSGARCKPGHLQPATDQRATACLFAPCQVRRASCRALNLKACCAHGSLCDQALAKSSRGRACDPRPVRACGARVGHAPAGFGRGAGHRHRSYEPRKPVITFFEIHMEETDVAFKSRNGNLLFSQRLFTRGG